MDCRFSSFFNTRISTFFCRTITLVQCLEKDESKAVVLTKIFSIKMPLNHPVSSFSSQSLSSFSSTEVAKLMQELQESKALANTPVCSRRRLLQLSTNI